MLRCCQDGRRVLVLLLVAVHFCLARPQFQPGNNAGSDERDRDSPPSVSASRTGAVTVSPGSSTTSSKLQYSDKPRSRDDVEKTDVYQNGKEKQEAGEKITSMETAETSKKFKEEETSRSSKNSTAAQLGQSIQTMASQLLTSHLLDHDSMVEADIRTPPKIKSQLEQKHKKSGDGHGVAVPVIIEDGEDIEKTIEKLDRVGSGHIPSPVVINKTSLVHVTSRPQSTTPSEGFSTWILLSGSNTTSQPPVTKKTKPSFLTTGKPITPKPEQNKLYSLITPHNKPAFTSTMTPFITRPSTYFTRVVTSNPPQRKSSTSKPFSSESNTNNHVNRTTAKPLLPTLTRKPNPAPGNKIKNQTRLDALALAVRRKPTTAATTTTTRPKITSLPYKEVPVTVSPEPSEDSTVSVSEDSEATATTKRTRRPGLGEKKKKKKNKNRRRRPTKKPDDNELESKVTDEDAANISNVAATKERPLTTRIYNYLAREVMPSVGVGLLGLVFTAGLAGLIMYPFGGGSARKTYEELQTSEGGYYGYNSEVDREGGMSDAEAFGKVLAGMKEDHMSAYNNVGAGNTVYGNHREPVYGDTVSRYGGGRVDSSQEGAYSHSETKPNFGSSQIAQNEKYGEEYSRDKYSSSFPVYNNRGVRYRQVGIGSSYPVNHHGPETQEVTLEDKITPVALDSDRAFVTSNNPSVQRGPVPQLAAEHGPRSLSRRRRDAFPQKSDSDNEIIPGIVKEQNKINSTLTLADTMEIDKIAGSSTTVIPTDIPENKTVSADGSTTVIPTEIPENKTSSFEKIEVNMIESPDLQNVLDIEPTMDPGTSEGITFNPTTVLLEENNFSSGIVTDESDVATDPTTPQEPFTLLGFLRRLIQFKIRIGLNFLRNSSTAFTRYLDGVQKRMDASYRNNVKRSANIQEIRNRTNLGKTASRNGF